MYRLKQGETARHAAQIMLGSAALYHGLKSPGWDGNPDHVIPGQPFYVDTEKMGLPAKHMTNPKHWGTHGGR